MDEVSRGLKVKKPRILICFDENGLPSVHPRGNASTYHFRAAASILEDMILQSLIKAAIQVTPEAQYKQLRRLFRQMPLTPEGRAMGMEPFDTSEKEPSE